MPKFYLRIEGVNIYNFVADTKDLSTIRGGGLILLNSIKNVKEVFDLNGISTGASSGLFEFEVTDGDTETLLRDIRNFLNNDPKYKHATFVLDILQAGNEENFVRDKETLIARNRWEQMTSPSLAIPLHNEDINIGPCAENKLRPAKEVGNNKISISGFERRNYGRDQKQVFYEEQIGRSITNNPNHPRKFTKDFEDLATFVDEKINPNLNRKMAVIYVDGNKFGKIQNERCRSVKAQRDFDENLQGIRKQLLSDLVDYMEGNNHWLAPENRYRIETLLWGGDEIIWVVPAWQGWRTMEFFYQQAQIKDWKFTDEAQHEEIRLTHSAGIVFCNHKAPIHRVRRLAEDLANSVKDNTEPNGNYFAYEILESFDHIGRDMEEYRKERVPVSVQTTQGTKALILNGDVVFNNSESVIDIVSRLKDNLPRRRLSNIVKDLLKADRQEEVKKQVREFLGEMKDSRGELRRLFERFGGESSGNDEVDYVEQLMLWMHLNALWDYLAIE